jgi:hypothetical protein
MKIFENRPKLAALAAAPLFAFAIAFIVGGAVTDKAMAQTPGGGSSTQSFAVGGFTTSVTLEHVAFAAHNNPKKPGVYAGYVVQEYVDGTSNSGSVSCVTVISDNVAVVSFRVDHGVSTPGTFRTFFVQDNGQPTQPFGPDGYEDCGASNGNCDCQNFVGYEPTARGNIVVSP